MAPHDQVQCTGNNFSFATHLIRSAMGPLIEYHLSGICRVPPVPYLGKGFGTRGNYIFTIDNSNQATFTEWARNNGDWVETSYSWKLEESDGSS